MVSYLLAESSALSKEIKSSFSGLMGRKAELREGIHSQFEIRRDRDLLASEIPTTCGVDGSYLVERLLAIDFAAWAAIIVEGLTPPSEKRFWPEPRFESRVRTSPHHEETQQILRATMMCAEMHLGRMAPHDVVLLDGSIATPTIFLNQGFAKLDDLEGSVLASDLAEYSQLGIPAYREILCSRRSDKAFAYLPKYSTRREIGERVSTPSSYDDRALLSLILDSGEFVGPVHLVPETPWHINLPKSLRSGDLPRAVTDTMSELNEARVLYYKPSRWSPAFRIETSKSTVSNDAMVAVLLRGLEYQTQYSGILEPYPLFLADRMVHHLGKAIPAIRRAATQETAAESSNLTELYMSMNAYRTE